MKVALRSPACSQIESTHHARTQALQSRPSRNSSWGRPVAQQRAVCGLLGQMRHFCQHVRVAGAGTAGQGVPPKRLAWQSQLECNNPSAATPVRVVPTKCCTKWLFRKVMPQAMLAASRLPTLLQMNTAGQQRVGPQGTHTVLCASRDLSSHTNRAAGWGAHPHPHLWYTTVAVPWRAF